MDYENLRLQKALELSRIPEIKAGNRTAEDLLRAADGVMALEQHYQYRKRTEG